MSAMWSGVVLKTEMAGMIVSVLLISSAPLVMGQELFNLTSKSDIKQDLNPAPVLKSNRVGRVESASMADDGAGKL